MESAHIQRNIREFELAKNVSLLVLNPLALVELRATGTCTVQIPEEAFDLDFPPAVHGARWRLGVSRRCREFPGG